MSEPTLSRHRELWQAWLPRQRWFAGKGRSARVVTDTAVEIDRSPGVVVMLHLVGVSYDGSSTSTETYQVPVVLRREPGPDAAAAFIGSVADTDGLTWHAYDGTHDPAYTQSLLTLLSNGRSVGTSELMVRGVRQPGADVPTSASSAKVMDGEQSNTSIVIDGAQPLICKVFRVVADGDNPDVVVQSALAAAGSTAVPATVGWVEGSWATPQGQAHGHLAFVQEFLPATRDAWRVAIDARAAG